MSTFLCSYLQLSFKHVYYDRRKIIDLFINNIQFGSWLNIEYPTIIFVSHDVINKSYSKMAKSQSRERKISSIEASTSHLWIIHQVPSNVPITSSRPPSSFNHRRRLHHQNVEVRFSQNKQRLYSRSEHEESHQGYLVIHLPSGSHCTIYV